MTIEHKNLQTELYNTNTELVMLKNSLLVKRGILDLKGSTQPIVQIENKLTEAKIEKRIKELIHRKTLIIKQAAENLNTIISERKKRYEPLFKTLAEAI